VIKTHYSGDPEGFAKIVQSVPAPIWIAGGPLDKQGDEAFLKMIAQAVTAGAKGVIIGRNVWQRRNPKDMITALCRIVHQ
jgi:DhnA family fructose-bisphosphate aldolase class Ia